MKIKILRHFTTHLKITDKNAFKIKPVLVPLLHLLFFLFFVPKIYSQAVTPSGPTNPIYFNTGIDNNLTGSTAVNSLDVHWKVGGTWALVAGPSGSACSRAGVTAPGYPHSSWITNPGFACSAALGNYSCATPPTPYFDSYYSIDFILTNTVFAINWQVFADGWVQDITVNGPANMAYNSLISTGAASTYTSNNKNVAILFNWCSLWNVGQNTIVIHIRNNYVSQPDCQFSTIQVLGLSPGYGYPVITGTTPVCPGISGLLYSVPHRTTIGLPTAASFLWTKPTSWVGSSGTNSLTLQSGSVSGNISLTTYSTASTGSVCLTISAYSVTVPPPLTITPTPTSVCKGSPLTMSVSGASTYTWIGPGPTTITTGIVATVSPTTQTTYTVKATTSLGCLLTKTVSVNILAIPNVGINSTPTLICSGNSAVLTATSNVVVPTYTWQGTGGTPTGSSKTVSPTITTTYTVAVRYPNGCANTATFTLTVNPTPTITLVASPTVICPGESSTITASATGTINSWNWSPATSTVNSVVVSPTISTVYTASAVSNQTCTGTRTLLLPVLTAPTVTFSPQVICTGIANTLTAGGASSYTWYIGGSTPTVIPNFSIITLSLTATTPYTVCGTNNTCTGCYTATLNVGSPVPLTVTDVTLCTNGGPCTTITAVTSLTALVNYTWQPGNLSGQTVTVCPTIPDVYTVCATSSLSCPACTILAVDIATNCCPQSTVGMTWLDPNSALSGYYVNTSYLLDNSIILKGDTWFQNSEVWITPGVQITVESPWTLDLDATHLYACGINMWQGIVVEDGGRITSDPTKSRSRSSFIEDAVVAIDLDNISLTNSSPNPPIDIQRMIFNRNHVGIKISNSDPALDSLALGISGCVFSSHDIAFTTFSNTLTWPDSDMLTPGSLRYPNAGTPTTGLVPPFDLNVVTSGQVNLKQPYTNQPGHIGIKIENMGDPNSDTPSAGVQLGITYPGGITNDFNLFDGLGVGIDVTNASFTSRNNTFENMLNYPLAGAPTGSFGGQGIRHEITDLRNARLYLTSSGTTDDGNRFWNCPTGILASNVDECWIRESLFRSDHNVSTYFNNQPMPGDTGISVTTNRLDLTIRTSEFNNLKYGIVFNTPVISDSVRIPGFPALPGAFRRALIIEYNYFGPETLSSTAYSGGGLANNTEYMGNAIQLLCQPNLDSWKVHPSAGPLNWVTSNRIDRTWRGILVNDMGYLPLAVSGNSIYIEDDYTTSGISFIPEFGYGVAAINTPANLVIATNTLQAMWSALGNKSVSLVYCENNYGLLSPSVTCNVVRDAYYGFQFNGDNSSTKWEGNYLCTCFAGLALTNSAVIGPQGDAVNAIANVWDDGPPTYSCTPFGTFPANWHTYCDDSDPNLSPLFVYNSGAAVPTNNSGSPSNPVYTVGTNVITTPTVWPLSDCWITTSGYYIPPPAWRQSGEHSLGLDKKGSQSQQITIFPNPTNGWLNIESTSDTDGLKVSVYDLSGKQLLFEHLSGDGHYRLDIQGLSPGLYIIEIRSRENKITRRKLVKAD